MNAWKITSTKLGDLDGVYTKVSIVAAADMVSALKKFRNVYAYNINDKCHIKIEPVEFLIDNSIEDE